MLNIVALWSECVNIVALSIINVATLSYSVGEGSHLAGSAAGHALLVVNSQVEV